MDDPSSKETSSSRNRLSDDVLDGFAAVVLIAIVVAGLIFWLHSMP